ncbi:MAG TPA: type II toxin-antitoxin system VapC family toxin [Blastocatellia bacterium]|nr:type II toxin-antitoxin system VapC family toxin [Blastocatellia bacterium]
MPDKAAFFDTSALVPLCVFQAASQTARRAYRRFAACVVGWTTLIEATGAVYRAERIAGLSQRDRDLAIQSLQQLRQRWVKISPSDRVRDIALDVLKSHDLRAADAIQLASALEWCSGKPRHHHFVCLDRQLALTARTVGFDVIGIP